MALVFHKASFEPSDRWREHLDRAYRDVLEAAEGDSNDDEFEALHHLVDELMEFAGIEWEEEDEDE